MAGIFDKMKRGVSDAGAKAKLAMDVSKLKSQINQLQSQINNEYKKIGETVYNAYIRERLAEVQDTISVSCQSIMEKNEQIANLNEQIRDLSSERDCPGCQKVIPLDTKFCAECGYKFEDPPTLPAQETVE